MERRKAVKTTISCIAIAAVTINNAESEEAIAKAAASGNGVGPNGPLFRLYFRVRRTILATRSECNVLNA